MDYTKLDRPAQNKILRQHGYRWELITQDWLDDDDDFWTEPGWHLYAPDGREVSVHRAFAEIERGVDVVAEEYRQAEQAAQAEEQKRQDLETWKDHYADRIIRDGVRPEGEHIPEGERVLDTANIYGGGDWFVIGPERIWYVRNNGADGDNWSANNVRTGGAGAIGWYIQFDAQIADHLQTLARGELPCNMPWDAYWN